MKLNSLLLTCVLTLASTFPASANWPLWRGPEGNGAYTGPELPLKWSRTENLRWRVPLPEPGNSTPIVWSNRVFLTQPVKEGNRRTLICLDRADGKLLWQKGVAVVGEERTHETNPYASASPVTDGERVVCWFGSAGLVAYDFEGKELWRTDLGKQDHQFGYGGSPVMHGDLVFLNFGPGTSEFLVAINKRTGKEVWRHTSPVPGADDIYGTWSTPLIIQWQGAPLLISALRSDLTALEPATGKVLWRTAAFGNQAKASPVASGNVVMLSGDYENNSEIAVRLGGSGDVTSTHVLWKKTPSKRRIPTSVIRDGHLYGVQTAGLADCIKLETGEVIWEERLPGTAANKAVWGSPILAGDRVYAMNQSGEVFVYRAGTKFEVLAVNPLGENSNSSITASNGQLILRTHQALWCVGAK